MLSARSVSIVERSSAGRYSMSASSIENVKFRRPRTSRSPVGIPHSTSCNKPPASRRRLAAANLRSERVREHLYGLAAKSPGLKAQAPPDTGNLRRDSVGFVGGCDVDFEAADGNAA